MARAAVLLPLLAMILAQPTAAFLVGTCPRVMRTRVGSSPCGMCKPERADEDTQRLRQLEDEVRDNAGAISYVFPRPLRKAVWGAFGANAFIGALILGGRWAAEGQPEDLSNVVGNLETAAVLFALLAFEFWDENRRKEFRALVARRQNEIGDRVSVKAVDNSGKLRTYTKLKPVDDEWIIRRIDRWGVVETAQTRGNPLPTVGPAKGKILEELVERHQPQLIVDVGTFVGYAAIRMGRRQAEGALTVTIEKEWRWWLAARRFVWQVGSVCQSVSVVLCFSLSVVTRTRARTRAHAHTHTHGHTYFSGWHPSGQAMATISVGS